MTQPEVSIGHQPATEPTMNNFETTTPIPEITTTTTTEHETTTCVNDRHTYVTNSDGVTTVPDGFSISDALNHLVTVDGDVTTFNCHCGGKAAIVVNGVVYKALDSHIPDFLVLYTLIELGIIDESDVTDQVMADAAVDYVATMVELIAATGPRPTMGSSSFGDYLTGSPFGGPSPFG